MLIKDTILAGRLLGWKLGEAVEQEQKLVWS